MHCLMGIDIGTSSTKTILLTLDGTILAIAQEEYSYDMPREGWAEQDPDVWWNAVVVTIRSVINQVRGLNVTISSIGLSGQMHGLVALDRNKKPVRKAIIWCDQRSKEQVSEIKAKIGEDAIGRIAHSPVATGFQVASLLWMKEHEAELYKKIAYVILPKDYIRYCLVGEIGSDITDAASTTSFDCNSGHWSKTIIDGIGLDFELYPDLAQPSDIAGYINLSASEQTGLPKNTPVVFGGADVVMQSIGNGVITSGIGSVNIGTGGQFMMPLKANVYDSSLSSHTFTYLYPDSWYYMGASLSAGQSLKWMRSLLHSKESYASIDEKCGLISPGSEGLIFLPYLLGIRTPHMDSKARGVFFGLTTNHSSYHLLRAVMEGVVYSLRDCMSILTDDLHQDINKVIASGGGSKSDLWLQMQADILGIEVFPSCMIEQAAIGAAIAAGIGVGEFKNYSEGCEAIVKWADKPFVPNKKKMQLYAEYYGIYKALYQTTKPFMAECGILSLQSKQFI
jgi:xylulokinase